jgi:hypothetical protein
MTVDRARVNDSSGVVSGERPAVTGRRLIISKVNTAVRRSVFTALLSGGWRFNQ